MSVYSILEAMGLKLDKPKAPTGNYLGSKQSGHLLYASGRVSTLKGIVGDTVDPVAAKLAARDTVLLILAIVQEDIGSLDRIAGVIKLQGFIRCARHFEALPAVLDGASELLIALWGEQWGRHARTATGVFQLPFGAAIQLDIVFEMKVNA